MGFMKDIGEYQDFGTSGKSLVPDSCYVVKLSVGDPNLYQSGSPFVPLIGLIVGGPLDGTEVESHFSLSPGKVGTEGNIIGYHKAVSKILSGRDYNEQAWEDAGFVLDENVCEGLAGRDLGKAITTQMVAFYHGLPSDSDRLALVLAAMNVAKWEGRTVVAHVGLKESQKTRQDGTPYLNNEWSGFYQINDPKKGREYVTKVAYPAQEKELAVQQ